MRNKFSGTFLKKYGKTDPKYWNQIKGRVYTKFSKNKVAEFSESGLYNFMSLFVTLAITADITNVVSKIKRERFKLLIITSIMYILAVYNNAGSLAIYTRIKQRIQ